jgi:hypothetical protein
MQHVDSGGYQLVVLLIQWFESHGSNLTCARVAISVAERDPQ